LRPKKAESRDQTTSKIEQKTDTQLAKWQLSQQDAEVARLKEALISCEKERAQQIKSYQILQGNYDLLQVAYT
jgi:hypothetical protein